MESRCHFTKSNGDKITGVTPMFPYNFIYHRPGFLLWIYSLIDISEGGERIKRRSFHGISLKKLPKKTNYQGWKLRIAYKIFIFSYFINNLIKYAIPLLIHVSIICRTSTVITKNILNKHLQHFIIKLNVYTWMEENDNNNVESRLTGYCCTDNEALKQTM